MGSALRGSLRISCFLTEGLFGYQSVKICQTLSILRTCFPNMSKVITFAAAPLVLTPFVRNRILLLLLLLLILLFLLLIIIMQPRFSTAAVTVSVADKSIQVPRKWKGGNYTSSSSFLYIYILFIYFLKLLLFPHVRGGQEHSGMHAFIYIYIYTYIYICIYVYTYIYIYRERERYTYV